jgi:predicted transcriptional regulator
MERVKDTSSPITPEEGMKLGLGIAVDGIAGMQKPINDKAAEFFSEEGRQKMHLRLFQLKEGLMERLGSTDSQESTQAAFGFDMMQLMGGQPDFLELSPEQHELITQQQKETSLEALALVTQGTMKMVTTNPEKLAEIQRLTQEFGNAQTDEEREEIAKKLQNIQGDMLKDVAPELKQVLIKGHEDFKRVLTDAQKAKIKAVMADMPDYMKKLLAEVDQDGGALSGLESWVPGMGTPGANPNREAPRQRSGSGGRAFPGN